MVAFLLVVWRVTVFEYLRVGAILFIWLFLALVVSVVLLFLGAGLIYLGMQLLGLE